MELKEYLLLNRKEKNVRLFFDIETLQYNEEEGKDKPSKYKNVTYSVAVSYFNGLDLHVAKFPNFYYFFETFFEAWGKWKTHPKVELIAHNSNKYDNHYLHHDIKYYYPNVKVKNMFLKNATEEGNLATLKLSKIKKEEKEGLILEKRIKSSNNLEMVFFLKGIQFYTTDNFMKTHTSIATLGKKLHRLNLIKEEELKTDFDYTKYNKPYDMTEDEAHEYAEEVYNQLSKEEITYIENDVIILGKSVMHYSKIFNGFDYKKITFTSNILESYNDNDLTSYQLLKKVGDNKHGKHIKYTDYKFANENFYDYLKPFYAGGLNVYNTKYIGKIIKEAMFAIDINSSYPYVMHHFKVPTYLKKYEQYEKEKSVPISITEDEYTLYRMTKKRFDMEIIDRIDSLLLRQILVKYYSKNSFINLNTYTLKMIENITGIKITTIHVLSYVTFECEYFGSRHHIEKNYFIKTQGKIDKKINMPTPYEIEVTEEENDILLSKEEIDQAKVLLNGVYGIPALRPYFNLFRIHGDSLENIPNGYKNSERNIVFSIFVTSVSLYNLLNPLKYLTQKEIDENLIYTDTDSLYFKSKIRHKLPTELFDANNLGKWDIQDDLIEKFYVLNHKKYAYEWWSDKEIPHKGIKKGLNITVKSGGIPHESFDRNMSFEKFIETQFSEGVELQTQKAIFNEQGVISIYPATTKLDMGKGYPIFAYDEEYENKKKLLFEKIKEETGGNTDDIMYIESNLGTFSFSELYPMTHEVRQKKPLIYLEMEEDMIRNDYIA